MKRFFHTLISGALTLMYFAFLVVCIIYTIHPDINDPPSIPGVLWSGCIFSFVFLYNNYAMTWHFDKALKKEVIDLTERIGSGPPNQIRMFRAMTYLGGILFYYLKPYKKHFVSGNTVQRTLVDNPKFINLITPWYKYQTFVSFGLLLISIIIVIVGLIIKFL